MDKNTIIGFLLIAVILIGFAWYNQPSEEELKAQQELVEKQAAEQKKQAAQLAKKKAQQQQLRDSVMEDTSALFHAALKGEAQQIVLKNKKVELTLNSKGATVEKAVVKGYKNLKGGPDVTLFQGKEQQLSYALAAKEFNISTSDLYFAPSEVTDTTVTFTATAQGSGAEIPPRQRLHAPCESASSEYGWPLCSRRPYAGRELEADAGSAGAWLHL